MENLVSLLYHWGVYLFLGIDIFYLFFLKIETQKKILKYFFPIMIFIYIIIVGCFIYLKINNSQELIDQPLTEVALLGVIFALHFQLKALKEEKRKRLEK